MHNILVLCGGNICRSPLAQALLAQKLPGANVTSAGLGALVGRPADPLSVQVAAQHGLDLTPHRAQQVMGWMCQQADLILVMEQRHVAALERQFPLVRGKVFRIGQYRKLDVVDPYRNNRSAFDATYTVLSQAVDDWAPRILRLQPQPPAQAPQPLAAAH